MKRRLNGILATAALCVVAAALSAAPSASAAAPSLFWKTPEDGLPGAEAGRFSLPDGIAADPVSGHLFVADRNNARIVELTAWGEFVKTWGWGVVASGPGDKPAQNEIQKLTVAASAGTYRLAYFNVYRPGDARKQTTVPISYNWPATDPGTPGVIDSVDEALEDLESMKANPGSVAVTGGPGDLTGSAPYEIEFVGALADKDIPLLIVQNSTLSGGSASAVATTLQGGSSFEICVAADGDVCQAGQAGGNAPGEIPFAAGGVAVDSGANVYVYETIPGSFGEDPSFRVQKFDSSGAFQAMWGGGVNKTKSAEGGSTEAERNLCTKVQVEGGEVCGTGVPGTGKGQFALTLSLGSRVAIGPTGSVFVGDVGRIQKFSAAGVFQGESKVPGETIQSLAMDSTGSFYVAFLDPPLVVNPKKDIRKLVPAGEGVTEAMAFSAASPRAVTVDGSANVYIVDRKGPFTGELEKVIAYDKDGKAIISYEEHLAESGEALTLAISEACELPEPDLIVSDVGGFISSYGPSPLDVDTCPPPKVAPTITKQFATSVGADNATVVVNINPRFWNDTRFYVEYGTGECLLGGCDKTQPLPPGQLLTSQVTSQVIKSAGVFLSGLAPKTTYHYRFVAQSTGGGPVYGIDPDGPGGEEASFEDGLEGSFKTRLKGEGEVDKCANAQFRSGAGARLPDCRAYEMVSPVDKENGDIIVLGKPGTSHAPMSLNQSSPDGARLSYSSYRSFGDAQSAPITSTYLANRTRAGWLSNGISPPRGRNTWLVPDSLDVKLKAFSADLCDSWLVDESDPPLTSSAPAGFANVYHRDNCGEGAGDYEALIPVAPPSLEPFQYQPEVQGVSTEGSHALFRVRDKLAEDAITCTAPGDTSTCKLQLYEALPGGTIRFVCVLPNEAPAPNGCSAGSASGGLQNEGKANAVKNAISGDGSVIFWSDVAEGFGGKLYARIDGTSTLPVSAAAEALSGTSGAQWWTAADDGAVAIFSTGELSGGKADLYQYALAGEETTKIAGKLYGLMGPSEDAQTIYLASGEALDGGATENKPNLYLYQAGEGFTFIGTLTKEDAIASNVAPFSSVNVIPKNHTAQVSADGQHLAFMSSASLTGYDNTDAQSAEADAEVFLYDAAAGKLRCVSCNPTNALPSGRDIGIWAAAQMPVTQTQLYQTPKVLSTDGNRLYFESFEALEAADTNGKQDVYQWEALGEGSCEESSPSFNEEAEGCVDLISSGTSEEDSSIVDISASGDDVFFATSASLLPHDPGLVDIYDARVGGGFPAPLSPPPFCEGEACQSPPAPPAAPTPSSASFRGPGNAKASTTPRKRCPKGKRKVRRSGKSRCVAQKRQRPNPERANHNGKAAR